MKHAFLSYVSGDSTRGQKLADALCVYGVEVWLDKDSVEAGVPWMNALQDAIAEGSYFIACYSDNYRSKPVLTTWSIRLVRYR